MTPSQHSTAPPQPLFYALLIGIHYYQPHTLLNGSHYPNLKGYVRDINPVENYLLHEALSQLLPNL